MDPKTVFVFSGFAGKLLGRHRPLCVDYLRNRGHRVHYFTNTGRDFFIEGGDDFASGERLRAFIAAERARHGAALSLCASGGGFGGLLHSVAVGIESIVGYSAITTMDAAARGADGRGRKLYAAIDAMLPVPRDQNLRNRLADGGHGSAITLFYPAQNAPDVYQAQNLAGCPGVTLVAVESSGHGMQERDDMPFGVLEDRGLI